MNTRTALRKSLLISPAEDALRRSDTLAGLDEAWDDFCSGFAGGSPERRQLMSVYHDCYDTIRQRAREAASLADILRA